MVIREDAYAMWEKPDLIADNLLEAATLIVQELNANGRANPVEQSGRS